jgi:hypothetical protein
LISQRVAQQRPAGNQSAEERQTVRISLGTIIWLVIGVLVASAHHYLAHVATLKAVVSAGLAIILWPLLLLGINLHVH